MPRTDASPGLHNRYPPAPGSSSVLKEVRFRYRHDGCWLQDTTSRHPGITLVATSIYLAGDDVVLGLTVHAKDAAAVDAAQKDWEADPRLRRVSRLHAGPRGTRFHIAYDKEGSIYPAIIEHTPVSLGPIRFAEGREYYQVIGESPDISQLVKTLGEHGELDVESVRDADGEPELEASDVWDRLTDKQVETLVAAHRAGYYEWPRRCSATDLARRLGLSSSAFLDHLRTAEAMLMDAQVQALRQRQPERA